jgi:hypothetical protein
MKPSAGELIIADTHQRNESLVSTTARTATSPKRTQKRWGIHPGAKAHVFDYN